MSSTASTARLQKLADELLVRERTPGRHGLWFALRTHYDEGAASA